MQRVDMYLLLTVSWVYTYVETSQNAHFKCVSCLVRQSNPIKLKNRKAPVSPAFPALVLQPLPKDGGRREGGEAEGSHSPHSQASCLRTPIHTHTLRTGGSLSPLLSSCNRRPPGLACGLAGGQSQRGMRSLQSLEQEPERIHTNIRKHLVRQML